MNLIAFVLRTCRGPMLVMASIALVSGACNAGLIAAVNKSLHQVGPAARMLVLAFVALGLGRLVTSLVSQMMSARFSQKAVGRMRRSLVRSILSAPLRQLEEIGSARLIVALTDDIYNVTQALLAVPVTAVNVALLLGGAAYLGWLSWELLLGLMVFACAGALGYSLLSKGAYRSLNRAREEEDRLFGHFRALTDGVKELKLHRDRRSVFLARDIDAATAGFERHNVAAENRFIFAQHWSHLLFFALIGVMLFSIPAMSGVSDVARTGYVITALYLMGPLAGVLSSFALFGRASIALRKVEELGAKLQELKRDSSLTPAVARSRPFESLELFEVTHTYHHEKSDSHFMLGPISLTFQPGELVFIVGGNGSGKSTLAKMITGLYVPESGVVRLNGEPVTDANRDEYRQIFSTVFSDFFVFETLLGLEHPELDARAKEYLATLNLDQKVRVCDGVFSTTALSQGQRKRLALLTAYLEDRPFYLFDEWASDQDPQFKEFFYTRLLRDLRSNDKAVVVITHDDKYFHLADRVIKLDCGQVEMEDGHESLGAALRH
ncbi:MAG TPA: cyclic peptide export ABC transporter [Verrucomicrobiae bacterium]|nr:cyclic peptide export ABC transporter [Verrucomicrobiae bacterium]